ncbi:MAG: class I SAM-dependent methyltransferase [Oscillospiraceae bacterium]|nr:class I SAM-dependent methyltransferase [Oscillospiraceae bacterium]
MAFNHPGGEKLTRRLLALTALPQGAKLLDFGCGVGGAMRLAASEFGFDIIGIDSDRGMVNACKLQGLNAVLSKNNVVDFPSLSFDGVIAECVLSLTDSRAETLHEFWCVLKRGGKLGISDIFEKGREEILQNELETAGFTVRVWEYHSREIGAYVAQAIMDGKDCADFDRYGKDTGYYLAVAEKP